MVFLTIEGIAEMSKTFAKDVKPLLQPKEEPRDMTIDLNSEAPLPEGWEQRLDIETGEIYYVNMITGEKTNKYFEKPNIPETNSDNESDNRKVSGSGTQSLNSVVTNVSPKEEPIEKESFVLLGCTGCLRYIMMAKSKKNCFMCNCDRFVRFD